MSSRHGAGGEGVTVASSRLSSWKPWLADAATLLSDAERARAARMKHARDAEDRMLAYALHRLVLGRLLSMDPCDVPLTRDRHGCPCVEGQACQTSLSHARDAVAIAVSTAGPVGVDIEHASRAASMEAIADEVLHPSERIDPDHPRAQRGQSLLETWVRKEAYLKASGVGLLVPMPGFALHQGEPMRLAPHPDEGVRDAVVSTTLLSLLPGYALALTCAPGVEVQSMRVEPA
ncbi:4'-phosphopantetheinyl transferase superfamily protein [Luteimonas aestuarii]|uniref:4'-phosphopantetheinyl transferase superfamily protein n=1 Tax=Luteimonas aestuarii TaxID=453837 RepID=A0A4R5U4F1_9GAMM|nr:4'-phosphopantetheinyl transferase superfamily protein [Luteimonas aestuarii]TDK28524.1 4'-phosphopantetheinyl transferase superfamily protein [Luteimonas aestuarii]